MYIVHSCFSIDVLITLLVLFFQNMCGRRKHIGMWLFVCSLLAAQLLHSHGQEYSGYRTGKSKFKEKVLS